MKSAYDLAMERLGGPVQELSEGQKATISEIECKYKAKLAEAELARDNRISQANGDYQKIEQIKEDFTVEFASLNFRRERDKEQVREES